MASELVVQSIGSPKELLAIGAERGASVEQMAQLFELQLRWEANEARKAFNAAMGEFKKEPPQINKNKSVKFGTTAYDHATLDHVVDMVTPALSKVGIRHRWENAQLESGWVAVTCILSHDQGHSESTTLKAQADTSGSKNGIQAIASTVTYLQRYTLLGATGLAAVGTDDDAQKASGSTAMPESEVISFLDNLEACATADELKRVYAGAYKASANDPKARTAFLAMKDKKKESL